MKLLKSSLYLVVTLMGSALALCWHALLWLIDLVDGGEEPDDSTTPDLPPYYNYRTSEIDPVKRPDGIYDKQ